MKSEIKDGASSTACDDQYRDENGNEVKMIEKSEIHLDEDLILNKDVSHRFIQAVLQRNRMVEKFGKYESMIDKIETDKNFFEIVWTLMRATPQLIKLIYLIIKLYNLIRRDK